MKLVVALMVKLPCLAARAIVFICFNEMYERRNLGGSQGRKQDLINPRSAETQFPHWQSVSVRGLHRRRALCTEAESAINIVGEVLNARNK